MRRLLRLSRLRMRRGVLWLWKQEGTPAQRARGLAAGVFCGCYPFFGLQIFLSVGVATLVRGNHLLAAAGTLVSKPEFGDFQANGALPLAKPLKQLSLIHI